MIKFYEDIVVGEEILIGSHAFTREAIIAYAKAYDPQPFHIDDAAAATSIYGSLIASGWHTACVYMRALVDWRDANRTTALSRGETVPTLGVSPGVRDVRWPNPVRPGDVVTFYSTVQSKRETKRPVWGLVTNQARGVDQNGREVLSLQGSVFVARRGG
jgi:acyl dehydratase